MLRRPLFICVEGADGTGKSTQSDLLAKALTSQSDTETLHVRFPDRCTAIGQLIDSYLRGKQDLDPHVLHLLFTANRWELTNKIQSALLAGSCVVCDRYSYSGIAYTCAKPPPTPEWKWCCQVEKFLPQPDLVICLVPENPEELSSRTGFGDERYETTEFQTRVIENYVRLAKELTSERDDETSDKQFWNFVLATNKSVDEVHACIMNVVKTYLNTECSD